MNSGSYAEFLKEALLLLKAFYRFYCASCGKPLRIGEEEIVVGEDFELYHNCCQPARNTSNH